MARRVKKPHRDITHYIFNRCTRLRGFEKRILEGLPDIFTKFEAAELLCYSVSTIENYLQYLRSADLVTYDKRSRTWRKVK